MSFQNNSIFWVEVDKVVPNPYQPRREFDDSKLKELSESIRMYGVLQPLTVCRNEIELDNGAFRTEYELIAGERRLRASKLAGLKQVPVLIREGEDNDQEKLELAIIENLQREDLNAVDRALAFRQLADVFGLSHSQVAKKVGRSREYVSNTIRLLNLPDYMLQSVKDGDISEGHARTLLMLNDRPEEQDTLYREILLKKLSVRQVELLARKIATEKVRKQKWEKTNVGLIEKEKALTETLGTRVQIAKTDYGGKITIDYFSEDDLDKLLSLLREKTAAESVESTVAHKDEEDVAVEDITKSTPLGIVEDKDERKKEDKVEEKETVDDVVEVVANKTPTETVDDKPKEPEVIEENKGEEEPTELAKKSSLRDKLAGLFGDEKKEIKPAFSDMPPPEKPHSDADFEGRTPVKEDTFVKEEETKKKSVDEDIYDLKNFGI